MHPRIWRLGAAAMLGLSACAQAPGISPVTINVYDCAKISDGSQQSASCLTFTQMGMGGMATASPPVNATLPVQVGPGGLPGLPAIAGAAVMMPPVAAEEAAPRPRVHHKRVSEVEDNMAWFRTHNRYVRALDWNNPNPPRREPAL